jgi:dCMP deaminase
MGDVIEIKRDQVWWDSYFLGQASYQASRLSKDPSTGVCVILVSPDRTNCPYGYNGFPRKMEDKPEWLKDRQEKLNRTIHAEMNAIINAKCDLSNYTLYAWPFLTCDRCSVHVIQAGITRVVAPKITTKHPRFDHWYPRFELAKQYYRECGVEYQEYDL